MQSTEKNRKINHSITAVTRTRPFEWENQVASLKYDLIEFCLDIEYFHASEDRQPIRDRFFSIIRDPSTEIRLDALIIEKNKKCFAPFFKVLYRSADC